MNSLEQFGWNTFFRKNFERYEREGSIPGRVLSEHRSAYVLLTRDGEIRASLAGRLRNASTSKADLPATGDWVAVLAPSSGDIRLIQAVLPRMSVFSRKAAGQRVDEQIVAANVDKVFVVMGLDGDFNVRRLERYLAIAWNSGAVPVVVLNKADLCPDVRSRLADVEAVAPGVSIEVVSATGDTTLESLERHLGAGITAALLGSSGAGKSTITNRLAGQERQATGAVRAHDDRGKHTTSHRELILLPSGSLLVDTPGMREIQLWDGSGIDGSFGEIQHLAAMCRFSDCQHESEPGCAVRKAVEENQVDAARLRSFRQLRREAAFVARKQDQRLQLEEKARWKAIHKELRSRDKRR